VLVPVACYKEITAFKFKDISPSNSKSLPIRFKRTSCLQVQRMAALGSEWLRLQLRNGLSKFKDNVHLFGIQRMAALQVQNNRHPYH
ncbi:hypothetical protein AVEN_243557-1, partial [Araneus ventricosus]